MGTRGEIYVRNPTSTVELWRHYDTYPDYMVPYFKLFAQYAAWCVGNQRHWLTYPEDVAAMLIAFDYEIHVGDMFGPSPPDMRPRGRINDFEKVWILDIPALNEVEDIVWRVRGFDHRYGSDEKAMRNAIRKGQDRLLSKYLKKTVDFEIRPENSGGCKLCGYPGPLIITENPAMCVYCALRLRRSDDFVRAEIQRVFRVLPLISDKPVRKKEI